nr:MAG TPA: minor capsid protein [Microviridae sp.]
MRNTDKTNQTNKDIANQNLQFQNENLQYQKDLQKQIFAREDNAVQRRVDDLVAAGLSPTLAAGSAANAGQAIETQALHNDYSPKTMPTYGLSSMIGAGFDALKAVGELNRQKAEIDYLQNQSKNVQADTANKLIFGENAGEWYKLRNYGLDLKNKNQGFNNEILERTKENQIKAQQYKTDILNNELYFSDWDKIYNQKFGIQPSKLYGSQWGLPLLTANNAVGIAVPNAFNSVKNGLSGFFDSIGELGKSIFGFGGKNK